MDWFIDKDPTLSHHRYLFMGNDLCFQRLSREERDDEEEEAIIVR